MLILESVAKEYNLRPVLDNVTLTLERGMSYSLSAANGSGKTTLLQIMAGLAKPTRGRVLWNQKPLGARQRRHLGVVLQASFLFGDLTAEENLAFYADMYGMPSPKKLANDWLQRIDLTYVRTQQVKDFSKGMKQRLAVARAMIHQPELLLLDEPFDGLDEKSSDLFRELIENSLQLGTTVFLVTHQAMEARAAQRQYTLKYGRLVELSV